MDIASLDLNLLVAFERLLALRSVTEAAQALGVTQPAMSRTLGRLRAVFSDPLFVRDGRALVPTPRALALTGKVDTAVQAAREAFTTESPFEAARAQGTVTLALGDETQNAFADAILESIWSESPGLDLRFRQLSYATVGQARRGEVDLALAPELSVLPKSAGRADLSEFVHKHVYDRHFVCVSSPLHPRARFTLRSYAAATHVVAGPDASGRGFVDDYLRERGLTRRVAAAVASFASAARIVAKTQLIAVLPDDVIATCGVELVVAEPPLPLPALPMLLLWHPRNTTDARHRFIRERVASAIQARIEEPPSTRTL